MTNPITSLDGLIVLQPYADNIINGVKKTEYRKASPPKDKYKTNLFLLNRGHALGIIKITNFYLGTGKIYRWEIEVIEKFAKPVKYNHPNGAQVWVKNVKLVNQLSNYCG